jgi:hypothetical protein
VYNVLVVIGDSCRSIDIIVKAITLEFTSLIAMWGHEVSQLVEALRYNPEGRGFDSCLYHWNFSLT